MRARTAGLHAQAERTGVVAAILAQAITRSAYALYLRNLLPAYQEMEIASRQHRFRPGFGYVAAPPLHRAGRIAADLDDLAGPDWPTVLPLLPAGEQYAARVAWAASGTGELLLAHAYTRYLGDVSGGQIMRQRLLHLFGPDFRAVAFTEFPSIIRTGEFAAGFRAALDEAGEHAADREGMVSEAAVAFEMNIKLSEDVASWQWT